MRVHLLVPSSRAVLSSQRYAVLEPALMPMALGYLGAALRERGHEVTLRDQPALTMDNAAVLDEIGRIAPEVLGLSVLTGAWSNAVHLVREVRRRWPDLPIVMGNTHAVVFADSILAEGLADFVVRGEGEVTFPALLDALSDGSGPDDVAGISWWDGSAVRHNPDRPVVEDLDSLPWPAWDLLDLTAWRYQQIPMVNLRTHPVPIQASRGCPYSCVFCSQDKTMKLFRRRRIERVVAEIDHWVTRYGFASFGFNDSYFPWDRDSALEFAERVRSRPWHKRIKWVTETRVDRVDDELMAALRASGLHAIFLGFESGNDHVLAGMGKGTTAEQGREAIRVAHRHGVLVVGFFMIGLPGETRASAEDTVRFAMDNDVDIAKFAVTVPYPGSGLFGELGVDQLTVEQCDQFSSWVDWSGVKEQPLWAPEGMTADELVRLQRSAMLRFYTRPSYALRVWRSGLFTPREMLMGGRLLAERALKNLAK